MFFNGSRARKPVQYRQVKIQLARFRSIRDIKKTVAAASLPTAETSALLRQTDLHRKIRAFGDRSCRKENLERAVRCLQSARCFDVTNYPAVSALPISTCKIDAVSSAKKYKSHSISFNGRGAPGLRRIRSYRAVLTTGHGSDLPSARRGDYRRFPVKMDHSVIHG